jgi:hypothetical protein
MKQILSFQKLVFLNVGIFLFLNPEVPYAKTAYERIYQGYRLTAESQSAESAKVYHKNIMLTELKNCRLAHYHPFEVHGNKVYWLSNEEIKVTDLKSNETNSIVNGRGMDFRVSENGNQLAYETIENDFPKFYLLNLKTGKNVLLLDGAKEKIETFHLLGFSSDDGLKFWLGISSDGGAGEWDTLLLADTKRKKPIKRFSEESGNLTGKAELALHPDKGWVVYSDFPICYDVECLNELKSSNENYSLFVRDIVNKKTAVIATKKNTYFEPVWKKEVLVFKNQEGKEEEITLKSIFSNKKNGRDKYPEFVLPFRKPKGRDETWITAKISPLARNDHQWLLEVITEHSNPEGTESACQYSHPLRGFQFDGSLTLQTWEISGNTPQKALLIDSQEITKALDFNMGIDEPEKLCTTQEQIKSEYDRIMQKYKDKEIPGKYLVLLKEGTKFHIDDSEFIYTQNIQQKNHQSIQTICLQKKNEKSCFKIITRSEENHVDQVTPQYAVWQPDGVYFFGVRTFGEKSGEPAWHGAFPAKKPMFIGLID